MIYALCKQMIQKGQTLGLQNKLDVYFAANRITADEYAELTELLAKTLRV